MTMKLDQRIRIESKQVTTDPDYGTQVISWVTFATVWAEIQDVLPSKGESQANGIRMSNRPARVRTRHLSGVTSDMRIVIPNRDNKVMQIVSGVAVIGRKEKIEFMAEEYSTDAQA